ncbi:MAG: hypothetical protein EAZ39_04935 [Oscillatoriales cyanobacterium]|nr:hypothetical protein [Microcoleus sp. PH2017_30_WIL_O_A]TAG21258.1 MAG: hypothetical protein EAZ39_04935 [Oscillatoriales cyanobacterium]TAG61095.1 MAG: hypothetical protein EAZ28_05105 [Oscillatoriales cyanobacterium]
MRIVTKLQEDFADFYILFSHSPALPGEVDPEALPPANQRQARQSLWILVPRQSLGSRDGQDAHPTGVRSILLVDSRYTSK